MKRDPKKLTGEPGPRCELLGCDHCRTADLRLPKR